MADSANSPVPTQVRILLRMVNCPSLSGSRVQRLLRGPDPLVHTVTPGLPPCFLLGLRAAFERENPIDEILDFRRILALNNLVVFLVPVREFHTLTTRDVMSQ